MALYVTRPRRDEERIGRGLPSEHRINAYEMLLQHDWLSLFFASCFEINVFYFTNFRKIIFFNNKTFPLNK